jgi:hypothetical protein
MDCIKLESLNPGWRAEIKISEGVCFLLILVEEIEMDDSDLNTSKGNSIF